jgi:hypothetical protein
MESVGCNLGADDGDVLGENGVDRLRDPLERRPSLDKDGADLPGRVDARVGPTGGGEGVPTRKHPPESRANRSLDGS